MPNKTSAPGAQQKRLAAYLDSLALAAGHADRIEPLKGYCTGLLLPLKRKSVEPMAARLAPRNVRRTHQSPHHLVADSPWSGQALLARARGWALPLMTKKEPLVAWVVDDTGIPKKGKHSVSVARQYCGHLAEQSATRLAPLLARELGAGSTPTAQSRRARGSSFPNQTANRAPSDSPGARAGSRAGRCAGGGGLWQ